MQRFLESTKLRHFLQLSSLLCGLLLVLKARDEAHRPRAVPLLRELGLALQSDDEGRKVQILASSPQVLWQGRTIRAQDEDGSVSFAWPGVQSSVSVRGAKRAFMLVSSPFSQKGPKFHVYVNGTYFYTGFPDGFEVQLDAEADMPKWYPLTLNGDLDPKVSHEIRIWFVTDPITLDWPHLATEVIRIHAFSADAGSFITTPTSRSRRPLFVGDSITAGAKMDPIGCKSDHSGSYAAKLCEYFQANCTTLAISGKGIYRNCCDRNETMAELWRRAVPGVTDTAYPKADFLPDAVIVNLGTNDLFSNNGSESWASDFIQAYSDFLLDITSFYGSQSLPVFAGAGPMNHSYAPLVLRALEKARDGGLSGAAFVNFSANLDGCEHPGRVGHWQMFETAKPVIAKTMGWA
eukprot:TRINITY_DN28882_c0_g1_i1.p1 TRINITY_DN28882_c0_g1~~TRINITY_DN28882_c0_g1_i1.p1  ORF type:complete len:418 (+),score=54.73 TRINITY_DN28882_c0_g1_i1:38-1255(+)